MIVEDLKKYSTLEKIKFMEAIWDDLLQSKDRIESPRWHEQVLEETAQRLADGREDAHDWSETKKELRNRFT